MLLGRQRDVCTHVLSTGVDTEFHQLKMNKTISERFMLVRIPYYLQTVMLNVFLNVMSVPMGVPSISIPSTENILKLKSCGMS